MQTVTPLTWPGLQRFTWSRIAEVSFVSFEGRLPSSHSRVVAVCLSAWAYVSTKYVLQHLAYSCLAAQSKPFLGRSGLTNGITVGVAGYSRPKKSRRVRTKGRARLFTRTLVASLARNAVAIMAATDAVLVQMNTELHCQRFWLISRVAGVLICVL